MKFAGGYDSRVYLRHTTGTAAVASFRTWRSSRIAAAQGPAIISACKQKNIHDVIVWMITWRQLESDTLNKVFECAECVIL